MSLIELQDVDYFASGRNILAKVSISILPEKILTIIGPNGAGKSTLVKLLLGLIKPSRGKVVREKGLQIGYMPQRLVIPTNMPLNVEGFLRQGGLQASSGALLAEVGVDHLLAQPMQSLSGGEHQRVLLARALLRQPDVLVLDEPVQGVDVSGQASLYQLIAEIQKVRQCAVVMVSHDLHLVMRATDEVVCLNGHVCCAGHPEAVSRHSAFHELFGPEVERSMALYTHHHDHAHDIHGDVVNEKHQHG